MNVVSVVSQYTHSLIDKQSIFLLACRLFLLPLFDFFSSSHLFRVYSAGLVSLCTRLSLALLNSNNKQSLYLPRKHIHLVYLYPCLCDCVSVCVCERLFASSWQMAHFIFHFKCREKTQIKVLPAPGHFVYSLSPTKLHVYITHSQEWERERKQLMN